MPISSSAKGRTVAQQAHVDKARARRFAMQAVYQHLLTQDALAEIAPQIEEREARRSFDRYFFADIVKGIAQFEANFDHQLAPLLNRPIAQLDLIEHAILLVAAYEFNQATTPPKVIINEAIVIAKKFGSEDSHKFINAVLDKLYRMRAKQFSD